MSLIIARNFKRANAQDSRAADAQFKVGDLVRMSEGGLTGKITKIEPNGHFRVSFLYNKANGFSQSFSANEIVMVKPAKDAAELRVVHAKGIGKWWVEPNLSRFNDADRERTHKERKEFPDREAAMKYARGTGKTFIVNDACDAMDANFKKGDTVRVDASYSRNVNNGIGKVVKVDGSSDIVVEFAGHGTVRVPVPYATLVNSRATEDE